MKKDATMWAENNKIVLTNSKNFMLKIDNLKIDDREKYNNYMLRYSINKIITNPHQFVFFFH